MEHKNQKIRIVRRDSSLPSRVYFDEKFNKLSEEIKSIQKALAHHRRDSSKDAELWQKSDIKGENAND